MFRKCCFVICALFFALPCSADDLAVSKVFEQVKSNATHQKRFKKSNSPEALKYSKESGQPAKHLVYSLQKPEELVGLIRLCKKERHQYDAPKFEPVSGYFIACEEFGIQKLGEMQTPEALKALEKVHEIENGQVGIMETWDEARAKYPKTR